MDSSPPKRVTRARAAAKSEALKATKIMTAAARAKTGVPTTNTTASRGTVSSKRKARAEDADDLNGDEEEPARGTRGTEASKKTVRARAVTRRDNESEDEFAGPAPAKTTRTRTTRKPAVPTQAAKTTRPRARKNTETDAEESQEDVPKKTTRARAGTSTARAATASSSSRAATKKSVKFQEADKENMGPAIKTKDAKGKEAAGTSIRGRPARRGGASAAGTSRDAKAGAYQTAAGEKKPLSPKKVTQMPFSRASDSSEDELAAMDASPKKATKSPVRNDAGKKPDYRMEDIDQDSTIVINNAILNPPESTVTGISSPARRLPASPQKETMKTPAKKMAGIKLPGSTIKCAPTGSEALGQDSAFKNSLLKSAAKRPPSPIKSLVIRSPQRSGSSHSAMKNSMFQSPAKRSMPGLESSQIRAQPLFEQSPSMKPLVASEPAVSPVRPRPSEKLMMDALSEIEDEDEQEDEDPFTGITRDVGFTGRLSAVIPRYTDPIAETMGSAETEHGSENELDLLPDIEDSVDLAEELNATTHNDVEVAADAQADAAALDGALSEMEDSADLPASESCSPARSPEAHVQDPAYQLREKDLYDHDMESDSEDELTQALNHMPPSPSLAVERGRISLGPSFGAKSARRTTMGLTALAEQLDCWSAGSPAKISAEGSGAQLPIEQQSSVPTPQSEQAPSGTHFFEDEIDALPNGSPQALFQASANAVDIIDEDMAFADVMVEEEDVELAQEAHEMSLLETEPRVTEIHEDGTAEDTLSEASQEYGDENEIPIDPALTEPRAAAPMTPIRPLKKTFNTTTKVPLKSADHSTPSPFKKRSFSASRAAPRRPSGGLTRSATVISYSPKKNRRRSSIVPREDSSSADPATPLPPVTPTKDDVWSTMGTPARTPRKDLNPALLRGAVVLVDVHTSEGADASGIFVELLTQMGARCLKTWTWNPSGSQNGESCNKIGITHVVFKDGGKRTMEKVREANGVVHCVGVSWVLDCERENQWLDEASYYIDAKFVPRGGARRRKSMEPKALSNQNGTLVSSSSKSGRESLAALSTPMNRRQSSVWMHTPSDQGDEEEEVDDIEWSKFILTPVPKTPAPETIAQYAAEIPIPETPCAGESGDYDDDTQTSLGDQTLLMRTCPPKKSYADMGQGILRKEKDEQVLMRLMAARRKSLQFAPKIGSPLARTWE